MKKTIKTGLSLALAASMVVSGAPTMGVNASATNNNAVVKLSEKTNSKNTLLGKEKAKNENTTKKADYVEGEAIVMYYSDVVSSKSVKKNLGADISIKDTYEFDGVGKKTLKSLKNKRGKAFEKSSEKSGKDISVSVVKSDKYSTEELIAQLSNKKNIISVQPNYIKKTLNTDDAMSRFQWSLDNKGQYGGKEGLDINADSEELQNNTSEEKVIAVIDTGVDYTHEDLADAMWTNNLGSKELRGEHGFDFVNFDLDPMDDFGHGSHCAGIIKATMDNEVGIAGVANADNIKIMALKILDENGYGDDAGEIAAFNYIYKAQKLGVDITAINCSYGGDVGNDIIESLINMVGENGAIVVAAAGNDGADLGYDSNSTFPASYDSDYIISVAATNEKDELSSFSNYGDEEVDIAAPGSNILSTVSYDCFNPVTYDEEKINDVASIYYSFDDNKELVNVYGEDGFDEEAFESCEDAIPIGVKTNDYDGIVLSGMEGFLGINCNNDNDESSSPAEISFNYSDEEFFGANENNKSLKVTLKNAKSDESYEIAIPYKVDNFDSQIYDAISFKLKGSSKYDDAFASVYEGTYNDEEKCIDYQNYIGSVTVYNEENYWNFVSAPIDEEYVENDYENDEDYEDDEDYANKSRVMRNWLNKVNSNEEINEENNEEINEEVENEEQAESQTRFLVINVEPLTDSDFELYIDAVGVSKEGVDSSEFGKYDFYNGTSMATPHVTGAAAVISAMYPEKSSLEVKDLILGSTRSSEKLENKVLTEGTLDLSRITNPKTFVKNVKIKDDNLIITGAFLEGTTVEINGKEATISERTDNKIVIPVDESYNNKNVDISLKTKDGDISKRCFKFVGKKAERINGKGINVTTFSTFYSVGNQVVYIDDDDKVLSVGTVPSDPTQPIKWENRPNVAPYDAFGYKLDNSLSVNNEIATGGLCIYNGYILYAGFCDLGYSRTDAIFGYDVKNNKWFHITDIPELEDWFTPRELITFNENVYYILQNDANEPFEVYKLEGEIGPNSKDVKLVKSDDLGKIPDDTSIHGIYSCGDKLLSVFNRKYDENGEISEILPNYIFDGKEWKPSKAQVNEYNKHEAINIIPVNNKIFFVGSAAEGLGDIYAYDFEKDEFEASEYCIDRYSLKDEGYTSLHSAVVNDRIIIFAGNPKENKQMIYDDYSNRMSDGKDNSVTRNKANYYDIDFHGEFRDYYENCEYIQMNIPLNTLYDDNKDNGKTTAETTASGSTETTTVTVNKPIETTTTASNKPVETTTTASNKPVETTTVAPTKVSVADTSIKKVTRSKNQKKAKLTLKKLANVSGYQVKYSTSKKFSKRTKTVDTDKNIITLKKLKTKKKYYVKVRAYVLNGKEKNYGNWSKVKTIK